AAMVSNETLSCTTLRTWQEGTPVNLERALKVGDELGGHIVSGHVDGVGEVTSLSTDADSHRFSFSVPTDLSRQIAAKGSITIDGISLTVNEVGENTFGVNIIPHTMAVTSIGKKQIGDAVNLEVDMLARYVARLLNKD
ncbi:MAG: riboflavin synthase, partial [Rhodospirillales bacterium]|nr:riboflavin synthase [Rhodospirillales bacterium]